MRLRTPFHPHPVYLAEHHLFSRLGKRLLLKVPTSAFFEVSEVTVQLLEGVSREGERAFPAIGKRYGRRALRQAVAALEAGGFLTSEPGPRPSPPDWDRGLTSLDLTLATGCNLRCRYCYGGYGGGSELMRPETAKRAVDFLIAESGAHQGLRIILFGGEPLLNLPLMRLLLPYAREQAARYGKEMAFGISTNGLLLTPEVIALVRDYQVDFQVSLDGPPEVHDAYRVGANGEGSYRRVLEALRTSLPTPIPSRFSARATLTHPLPDLRTVTAHLLELGFGGLLLSPAHGCGEYALDEEDWRSLTEQLDGLASFYLERIRAGHFFYFPLFASVSLTRDPDRQRFWSCGAGKNYVCVGVQGDLYLCHTWDGDPTYHMGSVFDRFERDWQERVLALPVDAKQGCRDCWARYLCGGGCWVVCREEGGALDGPPRAERCAFIQRNVELCMALRSSLSPTDIHRIERHFSAVDVCGEE